MRLVLDELYSNRIAVELRERGHDVVSITERPELQGAADRDLLALMAVEKRAILTENWADFAREMENVLAAGNEHYGVVFTSRRRLPRSRDTIGLYVQVLDDFLRRHPSEDALRNSYRWLSDTPAG